MYLKSDIEYYEN